MTHPITEQDRAAFEQWYRDEFERPADVIACKRRGDGYSDAHMQARWVGFVAALAYAREKQAERELELIAFVEKTASRSNWEPAKILAAFNAQEQGR